MKRAPSGVRYQTKSGLASSRTKPGRLADQHRRCRLFMPRRVRAPQRGPAMSRGREMRSVMRVDRHHDPREPRVR